MARPGTALAPHGRRMVPWFPKIQSGVSWGLYEWSGGISMCLIILIPVKREWWLKEGRLNRMKWAELYAVPDVPERIGMQIPGCEGWPIALPVARSDGADRVPQESIPRVRRPRSGPDASLESQSPVRSHNRFPKSMFSLSAFSRSASFR